MGVRISASRVYPDLDAKHLVGTSVRSFVSREPLDFALFARPLLDPVTPVFHFGTFKNDGGQARSVSSFNSRAMFSFFSKAV
jgi:hypothetical protein